MLKKNPISDFGITIRDLVVISCLIANAYSWYFVVFDILRQITQNLSYFETIAMWTVNFATVSCSAIGGASLSSRFPRNRFLSCWIFVGIICSIIPFFIGTTSTVGIFISFFLLSFAFGIGMPSCMGYYADRTHVENRGRIGGTAFFITFIATFLLSMIKIYEIQTQILTITVWRAVGLVIFLLLKGENPSKTKNVPMYRLIIHERPFLFYFVAWSMFCLVNYLSLPILSRFFGEDFVSFSSLVEGVIAGFFALVGGFLSDIIGRKRVVISGFIMLGCGYAILGIFNQSPLSWYFYTIVDGIAFGMLGLVFFIILWGDLSHEMTSDKYYALGGFPSLLSNLLQSLVSQDLAERVPIYAVFSLASFFLFLAVLPLMYVPETLPEKEIRERELKGYIEKAKKVKEKYT